MDDALLETLLTVPDDEALRALIKAHPLGIETVEALKNHSARFYFDRPAEALRVARVAYRLGNLLPDPAPALGRWTLANALLFSDSYRQAADLFDRARADYLKLDLPLDAARMGVGHVWALAYTGQFERALKLAAEVESVLTAAAQADPADLRRLGGLFNNVGIVHDLTGHYEEALATYDGKLEIARALDNGLDIARTQHNRACALTYLNLFDEALAAFQEAETGFQAVGSTSDLARLAYNRGTLYARWERYAEAEAEFTAAERWLTTLEGVEQARLVLALNRGLARLESGAAVDEKLLRELAAAQAGLATQGPPFEEGLAWLGLGRCHLALGALPAAQEAFERALVVAEKGGGQPLAWIALHLLGNLAEKRDDPETAAGLYEQAIARIEAIRRDLQIEAFRGAFLADKLTVYQDAALLYLRQGQLEQAFVIVERAKSRLLAERLAGRLHDEASALAGSDEPSIRALASRLRDVLSRLEDEYNQARLDEAIEREQTWRSAPAPAVLTRVAYLEEEAVGLARQIERDRPRFSPLATGHVASLQDLRSRLQDTLLLQYHVGHGRVGVFVVDGAGIREHRDLASLADVETARRRFSAAVDRALGLAARYGPEMLSQYLPSLMADTEAQLTTLCELLIRPLADYLPAGASLVISPDGPLHYVPFHALLGGAGTGRTSTRYYMVERYTISYAPSATVLDLCARRVPPALSSIEGTGRGMLVAGYGGEHLKQVTIEVQAVAGLFPEATLISEAQATTERLLAEAPNYHVLHLATHARFRADNVMLSSLSLADRRLTLAEISRLRLKADLVTLSGCETGHGRLYGADLLSLACGFLGAGVRSLLVSLWRADDATTARLMRAFYRALQAGQGRAEALRTAQRELLALGRERPEGYGAYRHPAYWAPFILIGEQGRLSGLSGRRDDA